MTPDDDDLQPDPHWVRNTVLITLGIYAIAAAITLSLTYCRGGA